MAKKYSGVDHIKLTHPDVSVSALGCDVAEILGQVLRGIYHQSDDTAKTDWSNSRCIMVQWSAPLSTFDYGTLTELVVLCHDRCVRMEIQPQSNRRVRLLFHRRQRPAPGLGVSARMPQLEDHVHAIRDAIGLAVVPPHDEEPI